MTLVTEVKWPGMPNNIHSTIVLLGEDNGVWKLVLLASDDQAKSSDVRCGQYLRSGLLDLTNPLRLIFVQLQRSFFQMP